MKIKHTIDKIESFNQFINESSTYNKLLITKNNKFELLIDNILVAETQFNIEDQDEFFNVKYVSIYELKTFKQFRGKGYARMLLNEIFNYVKHTLNINIITLIVDKDNINAVNLYFNTGFEIFMEYNDSYSLVKKL
jgi:ribosomal protein S18 acetylase RimI-like enzyme